MNEICKQFDGEMNKILGKLQKEYAALRAGRANPAIIDKIMVDYYGTKTPINQMAAISVVEARTLVIQPWDKSAIKDIEHAIQTSNIGINPSNDGNVLRIVFPPLTEERRKEICKIVHKMAEDSKISIRSVRREGMEQIKSLKKSNEITEDDMKNYEKDIQNLTDKYCEEIDDLAARKRNEIMEI